MQRFGVRNLFLILTLMFAVLLCGSSQQPSKPPTTKLSFEVASVRPNEKWRYTSDYSLDSDDNFVAGKEFFSADASLSTLIAFAYKLDLQNSMLTNLPKWASAQSYNVRARVPGNPSKDQVREMMKSLLAERFHLSMHFEEQEKPVFVLTIIRPDHLGPGLHLHKSCAVEGAPPKSGEPITVLDWLPCNVYLALDRPGGSVFVAARDTTMQQLCAFLSNVGGLGRVVVDGSGLSDSVDFGIEYAKARLSARQEDSNSSSEPLESALKNQLGVKLTPQKAMLKIPIVDHVGELTEN